MEERNFINDKHLREESLGRVEVLDKVKEVILLPYGEVMTTRQVADYFEVDLETAKKSIQRNKTELEPNGMQTLDGEDLLKFKSNFDKDTLSSTKMNKANRSLTVFTRRAILNLAMLLEESEIAKEIRTKLLDVVEDVEVIEKIVAEIDKEQDLVFKVYTAKTPEEGLLALRELNAYKEEKLNKVKEELKVAVKKVEDLTKSDATFGIREAKNNLSVPEKKFVDYLLINGYIYRQGRLKPYAEYTKEPTRYFTEIVEIGRDKKDHRKMVFTVDGIEYFRQFKEKINSHIIQK